VHGAVIGPRAHHPEEASLRALRSIGRTPERWKRRLRPALVRGVGALGRLPGAALLAQAARRLFPAPFGWVERRYRHYRDAGLGVASRRRAVAQDMAMLGPQAQRIAGWLASPGARRDP
jgi:hypothetical protein